MPWVPSALQSVRHQDYAGRRSTASSCTAAFTQPRVNRTTTKSLTQSRGEYGCNAVAGRARAVGRRPNVRVALLLTPVPLTRDANFAHVCRSAENLYGMRLRGHSSAQAAAQPRAASSDGSERQRVKYSTSGPKTGHRGSAAGSKRGAGSEYGGGRRATRSRSSSVSATADVPARCPSRQLQRLPPR